MSTSTPNHTRTDLRTIADGARNAQTDRNRTEAEQLAAAAVEDLLRFLTADAPASQLLKRVTSGRA